MCLEDKSVGVDGRRGGGHTSHEQTQQQSKGSSSGDSGSSSSNKLKALSPNVEVVYSEDYRVDRLPISKEEHDIINQGGNDVTDWRKIRLPQ
jgi:hypothetical protein